MEEESPHGSPPGDTENKMEDVSIYKLLFNVPSVSSCIFPSVVSLYNSCTIYVER